MEKSYVTIALCPICKKDLNMLLMDRRLKPTFNMHTVIPHEVCNDCKKKYLSIGVMLISPKTGSLVVLKTATFKKLFTKPVPKTHIVFCEDTVLEHINKLSLENK